MVVPCVLVAVSGRGGRRITPDSRSRLGWYPTRFVLRLVWPYPRQRLGRFADAAEGTNMPPSAS